MEWVRLDTSEPTENWELLDRGQGWISPDGEVAVVLADATHRSTLRIGIWTSRRRGRWVVPKYKLYGDPYMKKAQEIVHEEFRGKPIVSKLYWERVDEVACQLVDTLEVEEFSFRSMYPAESYVDLSPRVVVD